MEAQWIIILLLFFAPQYYFALEICEEGLRTRVQNGTVGQDGSLQAEDGTVYPNGTFWQEDHIHWACPCLSGPCVRICAMTPGYIEFLRKNLNATIDLEDAGNLETVVWENDIVSKKVPLKNLFKLVQLEKETKICTAPKTEGHIYEHTQLFKNGSLSYFPDNFTSEMIHNPDQFCLFAAEWGYFNTARIMCFNPFLDT